MCDRMGIILSHSSEAIMRKQSGYNTGMIKLNAKELRTTEVDPEIAKSIKKNPVTIILDNVLDTYNVGSIFRLADAVAATKGYSFAGLH